MARVLLGEALLLDLRPTEARGAALPATLGTAAAPWVAPRASLVVGRSLELEGDLQAAVPHYRRAALGTDPESAHHARVALDKPLSAGERLALVHLAEARRSLEGGRLDEGHESCVEALRTDPSNAEARICTAERSLRSGDISATRALLRGVVGHDDTPPWLLARARFVLARALERDGQDGEAVRLYKKIWKEPCGRPFLRQEAVAALSRLEPGETLPAAPRWER
jgi:tetratricopeptide (TPR) repeat protein